MDQLITSSYEHKLAHAFHLIDQRGLLMDESKLIPLRAWVSTTIGDKLLNLTKNIGTPVYMGAANSPGNGAVNINYSPNLQALLKGLGFELPKIRGKNKDTHEYEFKDSANQLVLQKVLANPELWPAVPYVHSEEIIKDLLEVSSLKTMKDRYVNARLHNSTFYSQFSVAATVTGRRGSKKHIFNLGGNGQNFPKHTELAAKLRECIIARPKKLFFVVDQVSAEDWPVQALSENYTALEEMQAGVNRHYKFAAIIFGCSIDDLKMRVSNGEFAAEMQYYLGKKSRHAYHYGMQPTTMSESLAKEGHSYDKLTCSAMLAKVRGADPNVELVFHKYVQERLYKTRILVNPFGRERQFFGLRQGDKNYKILNEAYAQIPQSVVADNNGLAILYLSSLNDYVLNDGHDSTLQEIPDTEQDLVRVFKQTEEAYNRDITFHNGIQVKIPIEGEIGYDLGHLVKIKRQNFNEDGLLKAYKELKEMHDA